MRKEIIQALTGIVIMELDAMEEPVLIMLIAAPRG